MRADRFGESLKSNKVGLGKQVTFQFFVGHFAEHQIQTTHGR
jgi:hypothetical protein